MAKLYSRVGHGLRELLVHASRVTQPSRGLRRVVVFAGDSGPGGSGDLRAGAVARALRGMGWRTVLVPPNLELHQRLRVLKAENPDVILLQQSRHPLNRPRFYPGTPCVFDADDADILDPSCAEDVIECCRDSTAVVAGSRFLAEQFRPYNPEVVVVWTGTYLKPSAGLVPSDRREPIVAWGHSAPLGYPLEAELVRTLVLQLAERTRFSFHLYGVPDDRRREVEGYLAPIRRSGIPVRTFRPLPYRQFVRSLGAAAVGLHPVCTDNPFSKGKSFGKLLAYLAADVAVVTSNAVDHPLFFRSGGNGILVDGDVDSWVEACERLLTHPAIRRRMVEDARVDFLQRLTTERSAGLVNRQLQRALELKPVKP